MKSRARQAVLGAAAFLLLSGCLATEVEVDEEAEFPVPLVPKIPINVGVHLPQELLDFVHTEDLGDNGIFTIDISDAQPTVFKNLFTGMFDEVTLIDNPSQPNGSVDHRAPHQGDAVLRAVSDPYGLLRGLAEIPVRTL
ncbi:MAG: hypothetical protein EP301_05890 [Gammaproteobacteria bacterium]|nr:MAG: hypothetical protein EP301_05890 [Gammaproteobacteria bacterium]